MSKQSKEDKQYKEESRRHIKSMEVWMKEQKLQMKINRDTRESCLKIADLQIELNKLIALTVEDTLKEYNDWRKKNGMKPIKRKKWMNPNWEG